MKDLAKRAILASGALRLISPGASAAILMYHSVMPDPAAHADSLGGIIHSETEFRAQMELLSRDYRPISLDNLVYGLNRRRELPGRSVVVGHFQRQRRSASAPSLVPRVSKFAF